MDNKVTSLTPDTIHWQEAMSAANKATKFVPLLNKKLAGEELKKLMAKLSKEVRE